MKIVPARACALALLCAALPGGAGEELALPSQETLERTLREAVAGSCAGQKFGVDPDLTRAARAFALAVQTGRAHTSGSALSFFASLESMEPSPSAGVATVSPPANADRAVGDLFPKTCRFNRAGVAAAQLPQGQAVVAVLTALHATTLVKIPGQVRRGTAIKLVGRLSAGLKSPRLFLLQPGGEVQESSLTVEGDRISARIVLEARGEHSIEVLAEGAGGPQVTALRRVFVGVDAPTSPPPERSPAAGTGLAAVEASIAQLRAAHGLPPVSRDPALDAVAEGHSKAMAKSQTFAHVLQADGSLGDRLRKSGYAYRSAGENIGLSADAVTAHEAVASSPAHLANLLDPRHNRLGLGAVTGTSPDGAEAVYLTEVLALPIVGAADPAGEIRKVIAAGRKKRNLPALSADKALTALAQHEISAVALAGLPLAQKTEVAQRALEADANLQSAVAELFVGSSPDEAAGSQNLAEPRWTRLGVGALYASSQAYGPGRLWVLILYGR